MMGLRWRSSALAVGAALMFAGFAKADGDTIRLGGRSGVDDAPIQRLDLKTDNNADTLTVRGYHGGGFHGGHYGGYHGGFYGGYRGFYGGYGGYRGFGYAGYGYRGWGYGGYGYRGYGYGYYRPYVGIGFGYGYGGYGYGYGGYGYPYYSGISYYYPSCYSYPTYYYGISYASPAVTYTLGTTSTTTVQPVMPRIIDSGDVAPSTRVIPNGTYPYDGGPTSPVPMPSKEAAPKVPSTERFVSIPAAKKYSYAAYGEKPSAQPALPDSDVKTLVVKSATSR